MGKFTEYPIARYIIYSYKDGTAIGAALLTNEQRDLFTEMSQKPEELLRLGAFPESWNWHLFDNMQDQREDTTIYLD